MSAPVLSGMILALSGLLAAAPPVAAETLNPLAGHQWRHRVLLVTAQTSHDPTLALQRRTFEAMRAGARDRDLVLVEAIGETAEARRLRAIYALDPAAFQAILIGKDGTEKMRSATILGPQQLFPTIDAMPMRQVETTGR